LPLAHLSGHAIPPLLLGVDLGEISTWMRKWRRSRAPLTCPHPWQIRAGPDLEVPSTDLLLLDHRPIIGLDCAAGRSLPAVAWDLL
jgi:hypothetical protein